jgi:hypothetical protein
MEEMCFGFVLGEVIDFRQSLTSIHSLIFVCRFNAWTRGSNRYTYHS